MKALYLLFILTACSTPIVTQEDFELIPSGKGIDGITRNSSMNYYLESTCVANNKRFQFLINDQDEKVKLARYYKKFNLELIELYKMKGIIGDYEVRFTQSGCDDQSLNIDLAYNKTFNNLNHILNDLKLTLDDVPFKNETIEIRAEFKEIVKRLKKNSKKYCKVDKNFVAFNERTLCNIKSNGLYYQFLWGKLDTGKVVINLSSSATF